MKEELGLQVLSGIMGWDTPRALDEFRWMKLISRIKYDDYQDFLAGVRFVESLTIWLQQFDKEDREIAYRFVKDKLVYISSSEILKLIDIFFPEVVHKSLVETVSDKLSIPRYQIWCNNEAIDLYQIEKRKILFMALSDGARIDHLRRSNNGIITNDQVVVATEVNKQKWKNLHDKLRKATDDESSNFSSIYLIDDFTGSGTSLIRKDNGKWTGKIPKFIKGVLDLDIEPSFTLHIHHYIGTKQAEETITDRINEAKSDPDMGRLLENAVITFGMKLNDELKVSEKMDFFGLLEKYYDKSIDEPIKCHLDQSGQENIMLGYGNCALPLILHHNTPNNSIAILWAHSDGIKGHAMQPLFRRMQRHTGDI